MYLCKGCYPELAGSRLVEEERCSGYTLDEFQGVSRSSSDIFVWSRKVSFSPTPSTWLYCMTSSWCREPLKIHPHPIIINIMPTLYWKQMNGHVATLQRCCPFVGFIPPLYFWYYCLAFCPSSFQFQEPNGWRKMFWQASPNTVRTHSTSVAPNSRRKGCPCKRYFPLNCAYISTYASMESQLDWLFTTRISHEGWWCDRMNDRHDHDDLEKPNSQSTHHVFAFKIWVPYSIAVEVWRNCNNGHSGTAVMRLAGDLLALHDHRLQRRLGSRHTTPRSRPTSQPFWFHQGIWFPSHSIQLGRDDQERLNHLLFNWVLTLPQWHQKYNGTEYCTTTILLLHWKMSMALEFHHSHTHNILLGRHKLVGTLMLLTVNGAEPHWPTRNTLFDDRFNDTWQVCIDCWRFGHGTMVLYCTATTIIFAYYKMSTVMDSITLARFCYHHLSTWWQSHEIVECCKRSIPMTNPLFCDTASFRSWRQYGDNQSIWRISWLERALVFEFDHIHKTDLSTVWVLIH